jgi:hypothetical protein
MSLFDCRQLKCDVAQTLSLWCTNPARLQIFTAAPNTFGPSIRNLLLVTLLTPRILRWLLDFWKICAPLLCITADHYVVLIIQRTSSSPRSKLSQLFDNSGTEAVIFKVRILTNKRST